MKFFEKIILMIMIFSIIIFTGCSSKPAKVIAEKTTDKAELKTEEDTKEVIKKGIKEKILDEAVRKEVIEEVIEEMHEEIKKLTDEGVTIEIVDKKETTEETAPGFYYLVETVSGKGYCELTIHSIEEYTGRGEYDQPEEGFRFIVMDVEVKNVSSELKDYSDSYYKAQDTDGYVYSAKCCLKEPWFSAGKIIPGQVHRGFVTIEVKEDSKIIQIIASPLYSTPLILKLQEPLMP